MIEHQYFVVNKPYGMVSNFTETGSNLSELAFTFPKDVYPVGRLDKDSEGLLLLTNDKYLNHRMTEPKFGHKRTYHVQVEGDIQAAHIQKLESGVSIKLPNKKIYQTQPCQVHILVNVSYPERIPPVRQRLTIPTSWIEITLREGKNRQIRKMTAQIGFPTLRLIRVAIEDLELKDLNPYPVTTYTKDKIYSLLKL